MSFNVRVSKFGDWEGAASALNWLQNRLDQSIAEGLRKEARFLSDELKKNLRSGGSPGFQPIRAFTRAIRSAMGIASRKPGIATGQVIRAIAPTKMSQHTYFAGVLKGNTPHFGGRGRVRDVADMALLLETGRSKFFLELDKPGTSGKTPRQWLWWLYLSGATKAPPNPKATHLQIGASPARPFVAQVAFREGSKIPIRLTEHIEKEFIRSIATNLPTG